MHNKVNKTAFIQSSPYILTLRLLKCTCRFVKDKTDYRVNFRYLSSGDGGAPFKCLKHKLAY